MGDAGIFDICQSNINLTPFWDGATLAQFAVELRSELILQLLLQLVNILLSS